MVIIGRSFIENAFRNITLVKVDNSNKTIVDISTKETKNMKGGTHISNPKRRQERIFTLS